jgi:hypothetical protein
MGMLEQVIQTTATTYWPLLTFLSLNPRFQMTDDTLLSLLRCLPGLTHVQITCVRLGDATLDAMATCFPDLRELENSYNAHYGLTAAGVRRLVGRCRHLTLIILAMCALTVADFPEAGPPCEEIHLHGVLHHLDQDAVTKVRLGADPEGNNDDGV